MNESITRAAGAAHGEELDIHALENIIQGLGRSVFYRNTLYQPLKPSLIDKARSATVLQAIELTDSEKAVEKVRLIKPGDSLSPQDKKVV
jgi:FO synthase